MEEHRGSSVARDARRRPFGLITDQAEAVAIARRLAMSGHRALYHAPRSIPAGENVPNLEAAATPADVARECTIIALAIDDTTKLREILFGTADRPAVALDMAAGTTLIDFGIRSPRESQGLLGILGMRAVGVIDAALIGGADAVLRGTAKVLAGGFPDAVDAAMPLIGELGDVERTGPLGSAQTAAALMGYVEAAHFTARSDALIMGKALGLMPSALAPLVDSEVGEQKIVRFTKSAELVRALIEERGVSADIIDLKKSGRPS